MSQRGCPQDPQTRICGVSEAELPTPQQLEGAGAAWACPPVCSTGSVTSPVIEDDTEGARGARWVVSPLPFTSL